MFVTKLDIRGSREYPDLLTSIYQGIAEIYNLPSAAMLYASLQTSVKWPDPSTHEFQVYYLENMLEENKVPLFQVRFKPNADAREQVAIFLSLRDKEIGNMSIQFPGRSGRGCFSRIMAILKSAEYTRRLPSDVLAFEVQGFTECGLAAYIKEHGLSAFVWIEGLGRYLHTREDPSKVRDIRRGHREL